MTAPIVFVDTETTSLHPDRRIWEIALIRCEPGEPKQTVVIHVEDVDLSNADPKALQIGGFYDRHHRYAPASGPIPGVLEMISEKHTASRVEEITRGAHLAGVGVHFDADGMDRMLRRHGMVPAWHYALIDLKAMAAGYLHALWSHPIKYALGFTEGADPDWLQREAKSFPAADRLVALPPIDTEHGTIPGPPNPLELPWTSDQLSELCGVRPPSEAMRHTAAGDADWARRWYESITGQILDYPYAPGGHIKSGPDQ